MGPYVTAVVVITLVLVTSVWAIADSFFSKSPKNVKEMSKPLKPYNEREQALRYAWKEIRDIERRCGL